VTRFLGVPILRKEDPALLSGAGRYADDLPVPAGTLHAHVIRSPHAHAKIVGIDATEALAQDGIWAVVTGEDVRALSDPFLIALKAPVHQWSLAVERVRYVGEPVALVVAEHLQRLGRKLPFHLDVIAFSEEEGVRFSSSFLGSSALAGRFDPRLLERRDADGVTLAAAMAAAGLDPAGIPALARRREELVGYLEVHIEQGPVLLDEGLPVGIVSAIAGTVRCMVTITGTAGHAGTVPMTRRHDAAAAAAELVLYVEQRCERAPTLVGTVGQLAVPNGAINIIPGRCELSLDIRAADDSTRDAAVFDVMTEIGRIAAKRGVIIESKEVQRTAAVRCSPRLQSLLADAVTRAGAKPRYLPSGAGHDAMMFDGLTDTAMLFVRCGNGGVSRTATMSAAMNWPSRTPASNPSAATSISCLLAAISTSTSG